MKTLILLTFFTMINYYSCASKTLYKDNPTIVIQGPDDSIDPRVTTGIDPEFESYVILFEIISGKEIVDIPINFYTMKQEDIAGLCWTYYRQSTLKTYREIHINLQYWLEASDNAKESLIFHELGHCVLDRDHQEAVLLHKNETIPLSIMYPHNIGGHDYYEQNREYYHKELIGE